MTGIVSFNSTNIVLPQYLQITDSLNSKSEFSLRTDYNSISKQKQSENFYKTDSIFSFRSQKGYVPSFFHNLGEQATAPFHFKTKEWLITGAAIGITSALILADNNIDDWATNQKENLNWVNKSSPVITRFGGDYGVYSVAAIGLLSAAFRDQKGVQTSLLATQAAVTSGIWVQLIKQLTGRERPKAAYIFSSSDGGRWHGPFAKYYPGPADDKSKFSFDAFPSGHTATAFSIATVFALQYSNSKVIPILSYSAASLVGISRLTEHEHWASDLFVGGLLGYLCGKQVVSQFNETHQKENIYMSSKSKYSPELTLIQNGNQIGLSLKW
jgi:membrane-associated phospholipid phosphatase